MPPTDPIVAHLRQAIERVEHPADGFRRVEHIASDPRMWDTRFVRDFIPHRTGKTSLGEPRGQGFHPGPGYGNGNIMQRVEGESLVLDSFRPFMPKTAPRQDDAVSEPVGLWILDII